MAARAPLVIWFEELGRGDVPLVGGKNASLGEMVCHLAKRGVKVPAGFATTADAYWRFVEVECVAGSYFKLARRSRERQGAPRRSGICDPPGFFARLVARGPRRVDLVVVPGTLPAIRQNRCGRGGALERHGGGFARRKLCRPAGVLPQYSRRDRASRRCRRCYASLFTDRAISYRQAKGFDHLKVALSIGIQNMVRSDLGGAGVMFSIDTETGFDKVRRHQRLVGARRKRRAGRRRSRRIPDLQAALVRSLHWFRSSRRRSARRRRK